MEKNIFYLLRTVHDQPSAISFLEQHGLLKCPEKCVCGSDLRGDRSSVLMGFECGAKIILAGRSILCVLDQVRLPLTTVIWLIYMWSLDYSPKLVRHELELSTSTVCEYFKMFREICEMEYTIDEKIGGPSCVVQIDESHLFTRKYRVGRVLKSEQYWVFGGIDENGNMFLERVLRRDKETLSEVLMRRVAEGSIIYSDQWRGYVSFSEHFEHHQVNHSTNFVNPVDGSNTQKIEATWSVLKRALRKKGMFKSANKQTPFTSFLQLMRKHYNPTQPESS